MQTCQDATSETTNLLSRRVFNHKAFVLISSNLTHIYMKYVDNTQQLFVSIIYLKKFVLAVVVALPSYMFFEQCRRDVKRKSNKMIPQKRKLCKMSHAQAAQYLSSIAELRLIEIYHIYTRMDAIISVKYWIVSLPKALL